MRSSCFISAALNALATTVSVSASTDSLRARLSAAGLYAVYPGDAAYINASTPFNERFQLAPAAIVYPNSTELVSAAVKVGIAEGLRISPKSGGHSYSAFGLGGENDHLVIDLAQMKQITVDQSTYVATIQTGNRLGDMAISIFNQGSRALPHGTCPWVGIGGHAAHGGFGYASRQWGLTLDNVVAHDVVLANGSIVTTSSSENADLFWALRGAGSSFGIITQYHMQTHPAPPTMTRFDYQWGNLTAADAANALSSYQRFCSSDVIPSTLGLYVNVYKGDSTGLVRIDFQGVYYGDQADVDGILAPFLSTMPSPGSSSQKVAGWLDTLQGLYTSQPLSTAGQDLSAEHNTFYAKSLTTPQSEQMTNASLLAFTNYLSTSGWQTSTSWFIQFEFYGGKNSKIMEIPQDETAYVHRDSLFTIQFYTSSSNGAPPFPDEGFTFLDGVVDSITQNNGPSWQYGAYPNYVDDRLSNWEDLYYSNHSQRLGQVKVLYDPTNVFHFPQSIPEQAAAAVKRRRMRTI